MRLYIFLALTAFFAFLVACGEGEANNLEGSAELGDIDRAMDNVTEVRIPECIAGTGSDCPVYKPVEPPPPPPSSAYQPPPLSSSSAGNPSGPSSSSRGVSVSSSSGGASSSSLAGSSSSAAVSSSSATVSSSSAISSSSSRPSSSSIAPSSSSVAPPPPPSSSSQGGGGGGTIAVTLDYDGSPYTFESGKTYSLTCKSPPRSLYCYSINGTDANLTIGSTSKKINGWATANNMDNGFGSCVDGQLTVDKNIACVHKY